jgi:hypothetical protein
MMQIITEHRREREVDGVRKEKERLTAACPQRELISGSDITSFIAFSVTSLPSLSQVIFLQKMRNAPCRSYPKIGAITLGISSRIYGF